MMNAMGLVQNSVTLTLHGTHCVHTMTLLRKTKFILYLHFVFTSVSFIICEDFISSPSRRLTRWAYRMGLEPASVRASTLSNMNTGDSRYVDFAYLDTITYVEVIFHSQHVFSIYLCISTPSLSKTVNMKQRVSRGDFSCPRCIFYYICYFLCRSK